MRRMCVALSVLFLSASSVGAVSFDWAVIGNPGNPADNTGYGSVGYQYSISKTEVTNAQYIEFLNAVAKDDTYDLYSVTMGNTYGGITRNGTSGSYTYTLKDNDANWANRPVVYVSWYDVLRFVNWLHNGQPTGEQDTTTTEYGAYDLSLIGVQRIVRLEGANVFLPNNNEWYKAAYYDPITKVYYDYATGTNTQPDNNVPDDDTGNSANYYNRNLSPYYSTEVGAYYESVSPYGTYDQSGNVSEWTESAPDSNIIVPNRYHRGGSWFHTSSQLTRQISNGPTHEDDCLGFRIASFYTGEEGGNEPIPEPASIGLVMLSLSGLALRRAKKS